MADELDYSSEVGVVLGFPSRAKARAVGNAGANAQQAGESINLSRQSGVPAEIIDADPEGFKDTFRQQKIVRGLENPKIMDYVEQNPLASKVSNDDYEKLDKVSKGLTDFAGSSILSHTLEGIKSGFGSGPLGINKEDFKAYPELYNGFDNWVRPFLATPMAAPVVGLEAALRTVPRVLGAGITGVAGAVGGTYRALGGSDAWAARLERDLGIIGQGALIESGFKPSAPHALNKLAKEAAKAGPEVSPAARTMLDNGIVPPPGADFVVDQAHVAQSKIDSLKLDQIIQDVNESATKERAPSAMAEFARLHTGEEISISADRLADLYIEAKKAPSDGDGLFGFVPDLRNKIMVGLDTGVEVKIPVADYVAHVDPTVHEAIKGDLRLRAEGVTAEEGKELAKKKPEDYIETYHGSPATFEVFDSQYMGSGEGAQAYAYGHYVAENKAVAQKYADKLAIAKTDESILNKKDEPKAESNLYRVRVLRKPEEFLDWDKPLSEQSAQVKAAIEKLPDSIRPLTDEEWQNVTGERLVRRTENAAKVGKILDRNGVHTSEEKRVATETLADLGIPGVKFLDQGSRGVQEKPRNTSGGWQVDWHGPNEKTFAWKDYGGEQGAFDAAQAYADSLREKPTRNFVVFSDKDLQITHRNNSPLGQALEAAKASLYLRPLFADAKAAGQMTETEFKQYSAKIEMAQDREAQKITKSIEKAMKDSPQELIDNAIELALVDDYADIMSQETRILARQAGGEVPLTREEVKTWVKDNFAQEKMSNIGDWESLRRAVERGGRDAEKALLVGKFEDAFRAKQRQLLAFLGMKELDAFQKKFDSTERKIDRLLTEPKIASMDQAHLEQARAILDELGYPSELPPTLSLKPLAEFIADSEGQLAVAHYLTDLRGREIGDLTTAEYLDLAKSLQSIEHVGRAVKKVENVHGKADLDNIIFDAVSELDRFDPVLQPYHPTFRQKTGGFLRALTAPTMLVERMFDYTDKFNPRGPITAYIDRPLRDSFNNEIKLSESAVSKFRKLQGLTDRSINDLIPNSVIPNRDSVTGLADLERGNLREIMGYMGSKSGIEKVIKGWKVTEDAVWRLIDENATKADWQWVQGMWEIYSDLHGKAQEMILRDTGVPLEGIDPRSIENAHGKWTGGYWPINYDRVRSPIDQVIGAKNPIFDAHYKRAATPHSYTMSRTEFAAPLDISGVLHWSEIQGQIHDIAFREAVRNASKFVNSPEFMGAFGRAWGPENARLLNGWLKDIANSHSYDENYAKGATHMLNLFRQNTVAALTYLNPGTVYKHGLTAAGMSSEQVGTAALAGATRDLGFSGIIEAAKNLASVRWEPPDAAHMQAIKDLIHPEKGEASFQFVMDNSPLMRNRQRLYQDTLRGAYEKASQDNVLQTAAEVRHFSLMIGRFPVALSDAVSALPTWLAKYKQAIADGTSKADAIFEADRAVGRAHGSAFIGDKSAIMRMPNTPEAAIAKYFTSLYNFWNHAQANVLQLAWDTKAFAKGENEPGAHWEVLARRYFKYVILPIVVEETASAPLDEHNHGFGTKALLATVRFFGGMLPFVREVTNAVAMGNEPSVGMMGTIAKEVTKAVVDASRFGVGKTVSKEWLTHLATSVGIATGLGGPQIGKTGGFLADLYSGKDKVDSSKGLFPAFNAYRQGLRTGHSKPRVFK